MPIRFELYREQLRHWPSDGRHILSQFDSESIVVYQAFRPDIAAYAIAHQAFGGDAFSYGRMSWIKPNFLWMMYRSGWATKPNQEAVLALRISRRFFDSLLLQAVPSHFDPAEFASHEAWQASVAGSDVRLQWDPDHDPHGRPLQRRAIQLGLRGQTLADFGKRELLEVTDLTPFVAGQREQLGGDLADLLLPAERVYES